MTQEVLKLALKCAERCDDIDGMYSWTNTITAIKEALAQPEQFCDANCVWTDHHPDCKLAQPQQEPVAWMYQEYRDDDQFGWRDEILFTPPPNDPIYFRNITPVYTHPPQRTWVGLTGEEIDSYFEDHGWSPSKDYYPVIKDIEAKLKELNT